MPEINDFENYPTPKKQTNWTLPKPQRIRLEALRPTNRTEDIEGAHSGTTAHYHILQLVRNKPDFFATSDIPGAQPQRLHPTRNKPRDTALRVDDIPKARPELHTFGSSRMTNPLISEYKLASLKQPVRIATPNKFIRDQMAISDIPGTAPGKQTKHSRSPHNILDTTDIPGTSPARSHSRHRSTLSKNMETSDIVRNGESPHRSHRSTDPLAPVYKVPTQFGAQCVGDIPGSKPKPIREQRKVNCSSLLNSRDIDGASPGDPYKQRW